MKIKLCSILVNDQEKALEFYTGKLGFVKKTEIPAGDYKWLTVVSPEGPEDIELVLEPGVSDLAKTYQEGLYNKGIPFTAFAVDDIQKEYEKLKSMGVIFTSQPDNAGGVALAVFDDTCGNLIQIYQILG